MSQNKKGADGLTKDQRYRLKDLAAYRKRKREYAKTPTQRRKRREFLARWREKNRDHSNAYAREWKASNKERVKETSRYARVKALYGLSRAEYDALIADPKCEICGKAKFGDRRPHVDHCHTTGRVRGVLCAHCNRMLGWVEKLPVGVLDDYLDGWPEATMAGPC